MVVMFTDIEDGSLLFVMLASNFDDDFTKAAKEIVDRYLYAEEDDMSASNSIGNLLAHRQECRYIRSESEFAGDGGSHSILWASKSVVV